MTYRLTFFLKSLLIGAVAFLATIVSSGQADDGKRVSTEEKANSISTAMESSLESLPKLYESVSKSIVRVEGMDFTKTIALSETGVIVSPEGHILVGNSSGVQDLKVHLIDGRTVTATPAGWSVEWGLSVLKINEEGPWPAIELGSTKKLKAGEPCLVLGYAPRGDAKWDTSPTARYGFIDRNHPPQWFTTTGFPKYSENPAVVGLDSRLLGIHTMSWTDGLASDVSFATAVDVLEANRDSLFSGKNLDWVRYPPHPDSFDRIGTGSHPELLTFRKTEEVLHQATAPLKMSEAELDKVKRIAMNATVRLVSKERLGWGGTSDEYDRWSGVIVSEDGYILTVAHTGQIPGERLSVHLSDGRTLDAVALGTNVITDIGLAKITTPGSWSFAEIAESSMLKPDEPIVSVGYPAVNGKGRWLMERTPQIELTNVRVQSYLLWSDKMDTMYVPFQGGVCGGGIFNRHGQYVAALLGSSGTRSEVAKVQWEDLKKLESIDTAIGLPHPLRKRFVAPSMSVAQSVVELLVDSETVSIGTVVDTDGWILTKASLLHGKVSCRLPDQSIMIAETRAESQEHDLALLKIDVAGLTAAAYSDKEPPSITVALCAVGPRQVLKPGIVSIEARKIPAESSWKGEGTEDKPEGPMISQSIPGSNNRTNLSISGTKLQFEDIIVSINGYATPNVAALEQVLKTNLAEYCTGDLVSVEVLRKGSSFKVYTPLPRAAVVNYWMMEEHESPRQSGFASVFDTDIELLLSEVGSPVIDIDGRIRGIAIASRGRNETQRGPTCVLPSDIVARVTKQLMTEAKSK